MPSLQGLRSSTTRTFVPSAAVPAKPSSPESRLRLRDVDLALAVVEFRVQHRRFARADFQQPARFVADRAECDAALLRRIPRRAGLRRCVLLHASHFRAALARERAFGRPSSRTRCRDDRHSARPTRTAPAAATRCRSATRGRRVRPAMSKTASKVMSSQVHRECVVCAGGCGASPALTRIMRNSTFFWSPGVTGMRSGVLNSRSPSTPRKVALSAVLAVRTELRRVVVQREIIGRARDVLERGRGDHRVRRVGELVVDQLHREIRTRRDLDAFGEPRAAVDEVRFRGDGRIGRGRRRRRLRATCQHDRQRAPEHERKHVIAGSSTGTGACYARPSSPHQGAVSTRSTGYRLKRSSHEGWRR